MSSAAPRSLLYVPASRRDLLAKVPTVAADRVVVDLEDGVAPSLKAEARATLTTVELGDPDRWWLRVAEPADAELARRIGARTLVVPKAESAEMLAPYAGFELAPMIETAGGVRAADEIARVERVRALVLGSADLRLSLQAPISGGRDWERSAMDALLIAARAAGCFAIDSVYFRFRDVEGLQRHGRLARELGFDGKSAIHPAQLEPIHELFASTPDERLWAQRVLDEWRDQEGDRRGVIVIDGEMIEALHVAEARRLLSR